MRLEYIALALVVLGLAFFANGVRHVRRRRVLKGCTHCAGSVVPLALAAALGLVASNLYTYARLTYERPVASLGFRQVDPQRFSVTLNTANGRHAVFELAGDEWQLDARVLKWRGWGTLMGLDPRYRLERLSGRYRSVEQELDDQRTVISLGRERGLDIWSLAYSHPGWVPLVDAKYGSATYMPMADGARYEVSMTRTGLIARPEGKLTETLVRHW